MIQNILYNNWRFVNLAIPLRGFIDEVFEEMSSTKLSMRWQPSFEVNAES